MPCAGPSRSPAPSRGAVAVQQHPRRRPCAVDGAMQAPGRGGGRVRPRHGLAVVRVEQHQLARPHPREVAPGRVDEEALAVPGHRGAEVVADRLVPVEQAHRRKAAARATRSAASPSLSLSSGALASTFIRLSPASTRGVEIHPIAKFVKKGTRSSSPQVRRGRVSSAAGRPRRGDLIWNCNALTFQRPTWHREVHATRDKYEPANCVAGSGVDFVWCQIRGACAARENVETKSECDVRVE